MKIGFIGLGIMGKPMAKNLLSAGHEVIILDHRAETTKELVHVGAQARPTAQMLASEVPLVLTMLPDSPQVKDVVEGEDGIIHGAHPDLTLIDMSSIAPLVTQDLSLKLAAEGVAMLDAPVSGGEPGAIEGTLSFMVGGPQPVFDQYRDVLAAMGSSVVRVGEIGAGNTAKLANQAIVAINIAAVSEALVLAQKAGADPEAVFEAIRNGLAGSNVMEAKVPKMLAHDFAPGFRTELHIKDLNNVLATSREVGTPLPLTAAVLEQMVQLRAAGHAAEDHSALLRNYELSSGARLDHRDQTERNEQP